MNNDQYNQEPIRCSLCNTLLFDMVVSQTNTVRKFKNLKPIKSKFIIEGCYKCGQEIISESNIVEGTVSLGITRNFLSFEHIESYEKDGILINKIKLIDLRKK